MLQRHPPNESFIPQDSECKRVTIWMKRRQNSETPFMFSFAARAEKKKIGTA
ncbi:hypothetical protein EXN66_Car005037 [Channa argus]|uniref:Uncharacterized protein n=1 Tax=Channa argus TaxID=215402 RepID=A0A6G1PGG3_CHAAH|nr:hypothetical protein EXN66_Car005037 [Channa argus]